ncbi:TAF6 [Lepeophtheirus salmonis]|uniref:TAF6 n=1 Tax=Lepeophtheirus salmonis TaxID=72036 RepID=A0A7R8CPP1_LEPSM|nr:TAF6 [Lepeophtheirus salmonis]CAF2887393.1 TAF6 [Lepeophtheirus salmonis]
MAAIILKKRTQTVRNEDLCRSHQKTVGLVGETLGITNIPESITRSLSEDASYRCREVVHYCTQFLRHGKRRKLTTNDFNRALRWYDVSPIFGQGSETCPNFIRIPEAEIFIPDEEKPINLTNYSLSNTSHEIGEDPIIKGFWLSIEGTQLPIDSEDNKPIEHPQPNHITPTLLQYYTSVTNIILGNSEEITLLPYFVTFIRNTLQKHCDNRIITGRLLYFLQSLFSNEYLNLSPKPYLSHLVTGLLSSLIIERRSREISEIDKLTLKIEHVPLASRILRGVLDRWATPVNLLRSQTLRALREYLKDTKLSYSSQYGALSALIALGPEVLEDTLVPLMNNYYLSLESKFESTSRIIIHHRSSNPELKPVIISKVPIKDEIKKEPGTVSNHTHGSSVTINEISTSLLDVYNSAYNNFGDSLCIIPLCPAYKVKHEHNALHITNQKVKFCIRKCGNLLKFDGFSSKNHDSTMTMVSKELEDPTPSDNIFSTSQNFDHLAHMGVPSDIFDETSNDGFIDTSSTQNNGLNSEDITDSSRTPVSQSVQNEFEVSSKYIVVQYPKISFYYGRPWEQLKRKSFEHLREDTKTKRNCFIGKKLGGTFYTEEQRVFQMELVIIISFSITLKVNKTLKPFNYYYFSS